MLLLLKDAPMFATWPEAARETLCKVSRLNMYAAGKIIGRRGEVGGGLRAVADGRVETSRTWADGRRFIHAFLTPPQTTHLADAFCNRPALYDIIARTNATVLTLPRAGLQEAVARHPVVARAVIEALSEDLHAQTERLQASLVEPLGQRLVRTLFDLARASPEDGGSTWDVAVAQEDLAAMLGLTRQSIANALKPLIEAGLVETRYRGLRLLDPARLIALSAQEPAEPPPAPPSTV